MEARRHQANPQKELKRTLLGRIAFLPALATMIALGAGCAAEAEGDAPVLATVHSSSSTSIFNGTRDDDGQALPGVIALRVGASGTFELCSGALIAPNVVLTARHCVTKNLTSSVACDENGHSANGPHVSGEQDPIDVGVYTGDAPNFATRPISVARAIVAPKGAYLCDSDIALVVLDTPITGIEPLAVRLGAGARDGETIRSVGYGQNDDSMPIGTRFRKENVSVLAQGRAVSASKTPLGAHEFEVGKSICQGDSGGPAISEITGAVIGVVSRGNDCDKDFGHIYTTTAGFEELFAEAFSLAGATAKLEPGSNATASPQNDDGEESLTAKTSEEPSANAQAGCSASGRTSSGGIGGLGIALAAALVLRARRRASAA
jgi:V8-like Glu-specific endopeptidase